MKDDCEECFSSNFTEDFILERLFVLRRMLLLLLLDFDAAISINLKESSFTSLYDCCYTIYSI